MSQLIFFNSDLTKQIDSQLEKIDLVYRQKKIVDFHLQILCNYTDYQLIKEQSLFNLVPQFISPVFTQSFSPDFPINLELRLAKDISHQVLKKGASKKAIEQYLEENSQNKAENSITIANNWYCVKVTQNRDEDKIGYQTLWQEIQPLKDNQQQRAKNKLKGKNQNFWQEIEDNSAEWEETGEKIGQFFDELIDTFEQNITKPKTEKVKISDVVKQFFEEDNWSYLQLSDGITLQLVCQGKNGQISCYARSYEEAQQCIFYSLFPVPIPREKRSLIAKLITEINYGMIIGNLEMDWEDGELRYKTSIDVEGDRLSTALVKRLVYSNVLTMDEYIPAINEVINK